MGEICSFKVCFETSTLSFVSMATQFPASDKKTHYDFFSFFLLFFSFFFSGGFKSKCVYFWVVRREICLVEKLTSLLRLLDHCVAKKNPTTCLRFDLLDSVVIDMELITRDRNHSQRHWTHTAWPVFYLNHFSSQGEHTNRNTVQIWISLYEKHCFQLIIYDFRNSGRHFWV